MSDTKISALTSATTPLAGTEVLPIVQSSTTVKVAVNDLTVRNIRAAATTGILQVSGPTAGTTRTVTVPDANYTVARTDAAQSFTGDQTLSTGNLVQGTAAKGINFTANTPASGMTSQLLNWYEEGTWTPVDSSGASLSLTYTAAQMRYTRMGRVVMIQGQITYPVTASTATVLISGLPYTSSANNRAGLALGSNTFALSYSLFISVGSPYIEVLKVAGSGAQATNVNLSGTTFAFSGTYSV